MHEINALLLNGFLFHIFNSGRSLFVGNTYLNYPVVSHPMLELLLIVKG
jgi:hypothetical protein